MMFPDRPRGSMNGSEFAQTIAGKGGVERDELIVEQILYGNVPDFMRNKVQVGSFTCLPDYLCVGSDEDWMYTPMLLDGALKVAQELGASIPTRDMVDQIWRMAPAKLTPHPLPYGPKMVSTEMFAEHSNVVRWQRMRRDFPLGTLTAGHKKDLIAPFARGRITIYGWHQDSGKPIQPPTGVHDDAWVDYSHGVRLVWI
jgi:hypothetical protein